MQVATLTSDFQTIVKKNRFYGKDSNLIDLIVFRMDDLSRKVDITSKEFVSKVEEKKDLKFRVHVVNSYDRDFNLAMIKAMSQSFTSSWLLGVESLEGVDIFTWIPQLTSPFNTIISSRLLTLVYDADFQLMLKSFEEIPKLLSGRIDYGNKFWSAVIINQYKSSTFFDLSDSVYMHDIVEMDPKFKELVSSEKSLSDADALIRLIGSDIIKHKQDPCNVMHWMPSRQNESLRDQFTHFIYRYKHHLKSFFSLFITNDKKIAERSQLFMINTIHIDDASVASSLAHEFCKSHRHKALETVPVSKLSITKYDVSSNAIVEGRLLSKTDDPKSPLTRTLEPIKVAIQVDDFHILGGLERVVIELATHLSQSKVIVTFINCGREGRALDEIKKVEGINRVITVKNTEEYKKVLMEEKIEFVNAHYSIFGLEVCKELSIPIIQTIHNQYLWFKEKSQQALYDKYRQADTFTSLYTAVSTDVAMYSDFILGLDVSKMVVIRNGLDPNRVTVCPTKRIRDYSDKEKLWNEYVAPKTPIKLTEDTVVLLIVATVAPSKGQQFAIKALSILKEKMAHSEHDIIQKKKAVLVIAGRFEDRQWRSYLMKLLKEFKVESDVVFMNQLEDTDLSCLFTLADMVVHPSLVEGWSLAVAESVYMGKDMVVTKVGGSFETVEAYKTKSMIAKTIDPPYVTVFDKNKEIDMQQTPRALYPDFVEELANAIYQVMTLRLVHHNGLHRDTFIRGSKYEFLHSDYIYNAYHQLFDVMRYSHNNVALVTKLFRRNFQ